MVETMEEESSGNSAKDEDANVSKETDFDIPLKCVSRWYIM